jgi:hypothetical protein
MNEKPKKLEVLLGERLALAYDNRHRALSEGDAYNEFIYGTPPTPRMETGDDRWSETLDRIRREEEENGKGWRMVSAPLHGEYRSLLLPALVGRSGNWENRHPELPPDASERVREEAKQRRRRSRLWERLAEKVYEVSGGHETMKRAVDLAMQYGHAWLHSYYDPQLGLPRIEAIHPDRVLMDCETEDDPTGRTQRWRAVCCIMSEADARKAAREEWDAPNYSFKPELPKAAPFEAPDGVKVETTNQWPTRFVKIVYMYVRGDSPALRTASIAAGKDELIEDVGKDKQYDGKDHVLVLEARGDWNSKEGYRVVARLDWPQVTPFGEDPLTVLNLDTDNRSVFGVPVYRKGHSLQIAVNWALRFYQTDLFHSSRRILGYVEGALDPDQLENALYSRNNPVAVGFKSHSDMTRFVQPISFGEPVRGLLEASGVMDQFQGRITNRDVFSGMPTRSHESATRAALSSEKAQLVVGEMADRVEQALQSSMLKALMAARTWMTAEQVASWIGEEYLYFDEMPHDMDPVTGEIVRLSPVWDDDWSEPDPEVIRRSVDIQLEPRSLRFVSPEQRLQDMDRLMGKQLEFMARIIEANAVNPALAQELARVGNAELRAYARMMQIPYVEEFLINMDVAATPPIQPGAPGGGGMPGEQPVDDVAMQAARGVAQTGMDPRMLPGELGEAAIRGGF